MAVADALWPRADAWLAAGSPDGADLTVVGVPSSIGSLTPSAAWKAPAEIRRVLAGFSTFDGEHGTDLSALGIADLGDWDVAELALDDAQAAIAAAAAGLDENGVKAFLGGDNAITRPLLRGLAGTAIGDVGLVTLDAHHDVRLLDHGPMNGTPVRGLIEDGLPGENVVQIGIHSFANSAAYRRYCEDAGIEVVTMAEVARLGIGGVVDAALDRLAGHCSWIYVDLDVDVLDRSFAPACPGARPGGMTPRQLFEAARRMGRHRAVAAVDVVEVDPDRDVADITLQSAATAILAFASGLAVRRG